MIPSHETTIRVRYQETDAQGHVHHANYVTYFEWGRTEQLRAAGRDYAALEREGIHLVVTEFSCRYFSPCRFGDALRLVTSVVSAKGVRVGHRYELYKDKDLVAEGATTVACIDSAGKPRRLPEWMRMPDANDRPPSPSGRGPG
jgi:acyl-CoA thioester hydrolase